MWIQILRNKIKYHPIQFQWCILQFFRILLIKNKQHDIITEISVLLELEVQHGHCCTILPLSSTFPDNRTSPSAEEMGAGTQRLYIIRPLCTSCVEDFRKTRFMLKFVEHEYFISQFYFT